MPKLSAHFCTVSAAYRTARHGDRYAQLLQTVRMSLSLSNDCRTLLEHVQQSHRHNFSMVRCAIRRSYRTFIVS